MQGDKILLTPTYHVFELYTVHHNAVLLPIVLDAGRYVSGNRSMPALSATASRDAAGRILTADRMNAYNTFEQPNTVRPESFSGTRLSGGTLTVELPPKSVVVLEVR